MNIYSNASLIILGSLISLMVFGCNKPEREFHQGNSVQQEQPIQDSIQENTMVPDQTGNTEQASHEQSDQPNTDGASAPSEAVLAGDNDNKPSELNSVTDNDIIKDSSAEITAATQAIYDSLIALQPEFENCYVKTLKKFNLKLRDGTYIYNSLIAYNIEYDEYGAIYHKEGLADRGPKPTVRDLFLDQCVYSVLPKSFDIDLSHHVNSFSDGVQKFGRLKLVLQTDPKMRTLSVYIEPKYSFSIGTDHPMVNEKDKYNWSRFSKHYTRWLSRRDTQEPTVQAKESATNTEVPKPDNLKNDSISHNNDDNRIIEEDYLNKIVEYDESEYKFSTVSITPCAGGKAKNTGCGTEERTIFMTLTQRCSAKSGLCEYDLVDNEIVFEAENKYNLAGDKKWIQPGSTTRPLEGKTLEYKDFFEMNKEKITPHRKRYSVKVYKMHIPWLRGRNIDDVSDEHGLGKDALVREMCQIQNDKVSNDC